MLELDPKWEAERAAKRAAQTMAGPPPSRSKLAATVVALLLAGLVALGIVVLVRRDQTRPASNLPGVSITIKAVGAVDVMIDGVFAGKTPLVFTGKRSTRPILIEARQLGAVQQVVPDHDQTVFLDAR